LSVGERLAATVLYVQKTIEENADWENWVSAIETGCCGRKGVVKAFAV
jgi:hypothetical protein